MSAPEPHTGASPAAVLDALTAPIVSAENYLAGVRARTRSLAVHSAVSEELGSEILRGILGAMRCLEEAAVTMTDLSPSGAGEAGGSFHSSPDGQPRAAGAEDPRTRRTSTVMTTEEDN